MNVFTRYLLRAHLGPFFFAFVALTGVVLINTIAREAADLAGKGLSTAIILRFFLYSLPANMALTLPMAVLVAVLYTFNGIAAENEVTALRASGIDLRRLVLPLFAVAALVTGGMMWFNDQVLPASNHRWSQLMVDVARASPLLQLREQIANEIPSQDGMSRYFLRAARIHSQTNRLDDVTIYDLANPRVARTIYADRGEMTFNTERTVLALRLFDGHLRETNMDQPQTFHRLDFREQRMRISDIRANFQQTDTSGYRGDREMTSAMLRARIDTLRRELTEVRKSNPDTALVAERERLTREQMSQFQVELHKKFSIAVAALVFVLLGVPLALRFPQGGVGMVIAASLAVFAIYYVGLIGGEALADRELMPPAISMWLTNILFAVGGLIGVLRMGRETGSRRGGGWENFVPSLLRRR